MQNHIIVKGARENNLKNVDVTIPRNSLVVITGVSGSGKSSLAFDTIFAEGQRRYMESLSSYARMFLGQMEKPDVDYIEGLSPAISIDQKTSSRSPRSTVGTVTEIYDYYRLLWAKIGTPHCVSCHRPIRCQTVDQISDQIMSLPDGTRFTLSAPVISGKKGEHSRILSDARKSGFVRAKVDGVSIDLEDDIHLDKNKKHSIELIIDRLVVKNGIESRLRSSVETAERLSGGTVYAETAADGKVLKFSSNYSCPDCGISLEELSPRLFSFNSPFGSCPDCSGLGFCYVIEPGRIVPDPSLSIAQGAVCATGWKSSSADTISGMYYIALSKKYGFSLDTPFQDLPASVIQILLYGNGDEPLELEYQRPTGRGTLQRSFEGIIPNMNRRYSESESAASKAEIEACMTVAPCKTCQGKRLRSSALCVTIEGQSIADICNLSVEQELSFFQSLSLQGKDAVIADRILKEIRSRLSFLSNVGLGYLTLSRASQTLSGGESQRIRLASQIGSSLTGVLYVLDEPSIGLHQRDNAKLISTLKNLRDLGNSVLVVEHDEETMRSADFLIDVGPGPGEMGGKIVFSGTPEDILNSSDSITGLYLSGKKNIPIPEKRRSGNGHFLTVCGAAENNLKGIDVRFPLGSFVCVTGVSGSGKSSLVNEILYKTLALKKNHAKVVPGCCRQVLGLEYVDNVIYLDQTPIGRTPRSNPATYTGLFNDIRELFASVKEARVRGYGQSRFSFNVKGGRCEACSGDGLIKVEMSFLPDVYVPCEVCGGKRYNRDTLEVKFKGKSIADVLEMTVLEALTFFENQNKIIHKLRALSDAGLDYIHLGQSSTTLSGGEAQRVKLATELIHKSTGSTVYILDEPTTGLHSSDVHRLCGILNRLVDAGNTVIVIEHNLDVIKSADWLIDLGPEGGNLGGHLVFTGTPEECADCKESYTGQYLNPVLQHRS